MDFSNLPENEQKLMQDYITYAPKEPRENLIKLVCSIDPRQEGRGADGWAYIFWNRQLDDEMVDFMEDI